MIAELGQYSLILALCFSCLLATVPLFAVARSNLFLMAYAQPLAKAMFSFLLISLFCLGYAFVTDDFSVAYVSTNSNTFLPLPYKISAIWGGHEGSLLLWIVILGGWAYAIAIKSENLPLDILARVLAVMGMIALGFLLFILLTSNPFDRILPMAPVQGGDLNPLLQDIGLIIHPPMLYMGYVGFSVAFAFAIAALLSGQMDVAWARWARPWVNVAWAFLTLGIALGSWWAYYELGWGGWWFWDPVENASFMPWLVGTALLHSLAVTEKRGAFKSWTLLLAIFTFSLCLLGTFLVRSGVLTSVHAFASDPERGYFILMLLLITIGGSFLLYGLKANKIKSEARFSFMSRETFLLLNNIVLVVVACMVLLGTLYPLLIDALQLGKISVGPPYFNAMFVPLMSFLAVLLGLGFCLRWKHTKPNVLWHKIRIPAVLTLLWVLSVFSLSDLAYSHQALLGLSLSSWVFVHAGQDLYKQIKAKGLLRMPLSYYGMQLAHLGVGVIIVGIFMVALYSEEKDLRMTPGERLSFNHYEFVFDGVKKVEGPNYSSDFATISVFKEGRFYTRLHPEKRLYNARGSVMTEAGIDPGLWRDLYVALGESLGQSAWSVRVQYKPFIRWIWLGALMMTLGGLLAAADRRYQAYRIVKS